MTNVWVLDHKKKVIKIDHKLNVFGITRLLFHFPTNVKKPESLDSGFLNLEPGDDLLSHNKCYTIIGAVSFHY